MSESKDGGVRERWDVMDGVQYLYGTLIRIKRALVETPFFGRASKTENSLLLCPFATQRRVVCEPVHVSRETFSLSCLNIGGTFSGKTIKLLAEGGLQHLYFTRMEPCQRVESDMPGIATSRAF